MSFEVITMGRLGIDLYPLQSGVPLGSVTSYARFLGGSAANVAVASARLPGVQGLVVGRALLYPQDDDVAAAVDIAAGLVART